MILREWVYSKLSSIVIPGPELSEDHLELEVFSERVFSASALKEVPAEYMFIVYRVSTEEDAMSGDDESQASHTIVNVWVYDQIGTYGNIEIALRLIKAAFAAQVDSTPDLISCTWGLNSEDLQDDQWDRAMKFGRYHFHWKQ